VDAEIDLSITNRDVLTGIIVRQQAVIEGLEKRVAQLEGQAKRRFPTDAWSEAQSRPESGPA
jgi:hypothetical protein